jgi:exopolyphosphatase/guanosine-5'-triphosphate,3'-diphosphate pyrophosphatase
MAFRLAADGPDFLKKMGSEFGWETILLSGQQEARLSALGVLSGLNPLPQEGIIFDIGGRSTEFIQIKGRDILATQSLELGVVSLTAQFIRSDPPKPEELKAMSLAITKSLQTLAPEFSSTLDPVLVGTAGTVTTIAATLMNMVDYDSDLVNNQVFSLLAIQELFRQLGHQNLSARQATPGLHPRRADVIMAGLTLTLAVMDFFHRQQLMTSDNSLLEGLWLLANGQIQI